MHKEQPKRTEMSVMAQLHLGSIIGARPEIRHWHAHTRVSPINHQPISPPIFIRKLFAIHVQCNRLLQLPDSSVAWKD
jgi:hypothetical protein